MPLELVPEPVPRETIEALETILERARAGKYVGFVIGLQRPRRKFTVYCVGASCDNPTWSRGMCLAIDDELQQLVYGNGNGNNNNNAHEHGKR